MNNNETYSPMGKHLLVEFLGAKTIEDLNKWKKLLWQAALAAKSNPLKLTLHKFEPQGVTGAIILEESHITFHTWPEKEYIILDIFTCGQHTDPQLGMEYLAKELSPQKIISKLIIRGRE